VKVRLESEKRVVGAEVDVPDAETVTATVAVIEL
jgi:hypothetical protein